MTSSGASAGQQSEFQRSFSALVECLRSRFCGKGTVSIPNDVIAPFRKPFQPSDNSSLRDLAKILENGRPHKNIARLDSQSFYYVASIVLHFPYSVVQSKLLYLFMDTVRQHNNEATLSSVLSLVHDSDLTPAEVKEQGDYIGRKLGFCVLRHLVSRDKVTQLRWRLAQFLSVLVHFSTAARDQVVEMTECQHLATILEADQNHLLRILVADVIRTMLYNGAERAVFGTSPAVRKIIENLPLSKTGDSQWMGDTVEYLNRIDLGRAVARSGPVFLVQRLDCDDNKFFETLSPFVASVSDEITFLLPKGVEIGMLTLFSVPVSKHVSLSLVASQSDTSTILEVRYPGDECDRYVNGTRSAINSLTVTFCDEESVEAFTKAIEERRSKKTPDAAPKAPGTPKKQSFAIIDISSTSGGGGGGEGQTSKTVHTSEIDALSPLRNISLRNMQSHGSAAASSLRKQIATTMSRSEVHAGEDSPALSRPPDSRQLIDRLRASREEAVEDYSKRSSNSKQSQLPQSPRKVDSGEGSTAKKHTPHLPADANQVSAPASSESKPTGKRPADLPSSSLSNQAKKRSKSAVTTGQASVDGDAHNSSRQHVRIKETMARLTGAGKDDSQGSTASAKPGLKRRPDKEPTTSKAGQPQKASNATSNAVEFDIPQSDDEDIRPAKKTKTKTNKPSTKAATKDPTERKKIAAQVTASSKGRKKKETDKPKAKKSTDNKSETTAASSRARRAPKTPRYIENSDESEDIAAGKDSDDEEDVLDDQNDDSHQETAEDSYPVENGTYEAATQISQADFESQLLPEMADRGSTDGEVIPRVRNPQESAASQRDISTGTPLVRKPSGKQKEAVTSVSENTAEQPVPKDDPKVHKPTAAEVVSSRNNPSINDPTDVQTIAVKNLATVMVTDKETPAKEKVRRQSSILKEATPRRNTKRLSETSIPPASEKLLRKTPIVHFGPQGPANQAVQDKLAGKEVRFKGVVESQDHSPATKRSDREYLEQTDEFAEQLEPSPDNPNSTCKAGATGEGAQNDPGQESYEFPAPAEPADDMDMESVDEPVQLGSEAMVKSPEVDETQPQSPHGADGAGAEFAEEERESEEALARVEEAQVEIGKAHDKVSAVQSSDSDDTSFVDRSYDQEASEYIASEVEEEASVRSLPEPEPQPPRKSDTRPYRPQTPLLDDDEPGRGYQRAKEPPKSREASRQSVGVSTILDEGYPTAQKVINTQKLRHDPQEIPANQSSRTKTSLTALPPITQRRKKSQTAEPADGVDNPQEVRKSNTETIALSVSPGRATSGSKSNKPDFTIQTGQGRLQKASFHHAFSNVESRVDEEKVPAPKPRPQTLTRAQSKTLSTNMSSTSLTTSAAQPMAPPPLPQTLPSRATRKPDPPRKSWPESRAEKMSRLVDAVVKDPIKSSKPSNPEPVRIKKRTTLPLAASELLPEPDLPPATPASLSTRLDLHVNLPIHAAHNDEDSRMEDVGQKLGNGSMALVDEEEESVCGDRVAIWARVGRRQRSDSGDDDMSMAASPSRTKGQTEVRDNSTVRELTARDSQRGLLAAIISIANDVLFRFGNEEDAIKAKVDEYDRGGKAVADTLMDTWTQRLEHEHKILQDGLRAEKEFLNTAARLVDDKHTGGAWIRVVSDDGLVDKVQKKSTRLTKQIEALMQ